MQVTGLWIFVVVVVVAVVAAEAFNSGWTHGFKNCAELKDSEIDRLVQEVKDLRRVLDRERVSRWNP